MHRLLKWSINLARSLFGICFGRGLLGFLLLDSIRYQFSNNSFRLYIFDLIWFLYGHYTFILAIFSSSTWEDSWRCLLSRPNRPSDSFRSYKYILEAMRIRRTKAFIGHLILYPYHNTCGSTVYQSLYFSVF